MIEELKAMFTFGCAKKKEKKTALPPVTQKIDPPAMKAPKANSSVYCSKLLFVDYDGCRLFFNDDSAFEWRCEYTNRFERIMHTNLARIECSYQNTETKAVYFARAYLILGSHNRVIRYSNGSTYPYLFVELTRENFDKLVSAK